jgi:hypothetical protein
MQLTDAQKQSVKQWAAEGLGLSDIQKRIGAEFGVALTYMDVRFLAIDLGLQIKEKRSAPARPIPPPAAEPEQVPLTENEPAGIPEEGGTSSVTIETDRVMKPGSLVSGTVKFSDGVTGAWMLDQYGRLGLTTSKPAYRPSPADVHAFQEELRRVLERQGF